MKMLVSIIINTYKRKESLLRLLTSLQPEMEPDYEIIIIEQVINNGKEILAFAKVNQLNLSYYFLEKPSTTRAKNFGVKQAKGEFIVFLDDDVSALPSLIKNHLKNYTEQHIGGISGRVLLKEGEKNTETGRTGHISFWGTFSDGYTSLKRQEIDTVIGCNASWRKVALEKINVFDEQFTGRNAMREESDLSLRVKALGYTIIYDPTAVVQDMREMTGGARKTEGRIEWFFDFFNNETYFFLKHRPWFVLPFILLTRWEWAARCMFGFGREVSWRSMITPFAGVLYGIRKYRKRR